MNGKQHGKEIHYYDDQSIMYCINWVNDEYEIINDLCFRCGREGHYVADCYAVKHANGQYLKKADKNTSSSCIIH